jgi:hypothetical protein
MEARPCTRLHGEKPIASNTLAPRIAPLSQFLPLVSCRKHGFHPVLHVAHHGVDISSVAFLGPLVENLLVQTLRQPLISSSSNEHHSPAVTVPDGDRQEETRDIGLESMRTRKTATRIACTVLPVPFIRIDTEDVREALRGL